MNTNKNSDLEIVRNWNFSGDRGSSTKMMMMMGSQKLFCCMLTKAGGQRIE
jgi:hypothetical protein